MKELLMMILFHISIYLTNSLNLNNEFIDTFFKNKKSDIFTNSTHDVEYFLQNFNKTEYDSLCSKYSENCLKFLNQYNVKFYENLDEKSDDNISGYNTIKYNEYMAEILYKISEFKYYGTFTDSPNVKEGIKGFIISSYYGNSFAQYKISVLLENNIISIFFSNIQADIKFEEFEKGVEPYLYKDDLLLAYILLNKNYLNNFDFTDNLEKNSLALTLLYLSSSQNSYAKLALGNKYYRGIGVQKNLDVAINYYREEAYNTVEYHNRINRPNYIEKINLISKEYMSYKYSSKEVGSVDDIIEYYKLEAKKGLISYILNLGKRYLFGQDVEQNFIQAHHYFEYGASLNDTNCKYFLGELYLNGWGVETNYTKAYEIFFDTISFPKSANSLGYMYYYGFGVEKDINRAYELFQSKFDF